MCTKNTASGHLQGYKSAYATSRSALNRKDGSRRVLYSGLLRCVSDHLSENPSASSASLSSDWERTIYREFLLKLKIAFRLLSFKINFSGCARYLKDTRCYMPLSRQYRPTLIFFRLIQLSFQRFISSSDEAALAAGLHWTGIVHTLPPTVCMWNGLLEEEYHYRPMRIWLFNFKLLANRQRGNVA